VASDSFTGFGRDDLPQALHSNSARSELAAELGLFGQFVGSWALECMLYNPDGSAGTVMHGELRFGWVLGGRAVQDVWIVPGRDHPDEGKAPGFHGTTIRFYDPGLGAWRSTWIDPPNNRVRRFIGRPVDADIELISDEGIEPTWRWRFTDIAPDSFTWTSEKATKEQPAWTDEVRMRATRITTAAETEQSASSPVSAGRG
jgi:hypothetical protein